MNKKIVLVTLFVPSILLALLVTFEFVVQYTMPEVTVSIGGYDPRDFLSGHYLRYTIDWDKTDCSQFNENKCPITDFKCSGYMGSCRYYIPEEYAYSLDRMLGMGENSFEIVYKYTPGKTPKAQRLLIDGEDWQQNANIKSGKNK